MEWTKIDQHHKWGQTIQAQKTTTAQVWAHKAQEKKLEAPEKELPKEYQKHWKVFSKNLAQRFPPKWREDMAIEWLLGAPTSINCKIYPLNSKETKTLKEFLEEEEKKGYITPGSSLYTALVFFVGKKDSQELWPVMDYRELNKWDKEGQ